MPGAMPIRDFQRVFIAGGGKWLAMNEPRGGTLERTCLLLDCDKIRSGLVGAVPHEAPRQAVHAIAAQNHVACFHFPVAQRDFNSSGNMLDVLHSA